MALLRSATGIIAVLTVVAFLLVAAFEREVIAFVLGGFIPARVGGLFPLSSAVPMLLTPLSATLLHAGFAHLAFNLLLLVLCGLRLEAVIGPARLVALYIVGAYAAAAAQWLMDPVAAVPMVGASGAVSALIGAFAMQFGRVKPFTRSPALDRLLNVIWLLAAWIVLQLMLDFMGVMGGTLIATAAHVGGFIAGIGMFGILARGHRPTNQWDRP